MTLRGMFMPLELVDKSTEDAKESARKSSSAESDLAAQLKKLQEEKTQLKVELKTTNVNAVHRTSQAEIEVKAIADMTASEEEKMHGLTRNGSRERK